MKNKLKAFCAEEEEIVWVGDQLEVTIHTFKLHSLYEVIGDEYFEEEGHQIEWQGDRVLINLNPICEFFEIDPKEVYPEES